MEVNYFLFTDLKLKSFLAVPDMRFARSTNQNYFQNFIYSFEKFNEKN